MKKYAEILREIENARASMRDTSKTEKQLDHLLLREALRNGEPEQIEKARAAYKAAEARYIEECTHNDNLNIKIEILKDNAKQALFSETIGTICDIWNKYENKPHGEKTAQKIRDELKTATGYYISIGNRYDDARITLYNRGNMDNIEICPIWNGEKQPALTNNNKIVRLNPENMRVYYCGAYVDDVDAHIIALRTAHSAAIAAEEALKEAVNKYNELTRGSIQHASSREGVKHYLI